MLVTLLSLDRGWVRLELSSYRMVLQTAVIYLLSRKIIIPSAKFTHQLTINRSKLIKRIEIPPEAYDFALTRTRPKGILQDIQKSAQMVWGRVCGFLSLSLRAGHLSILFGPILCFGLPLYMIGCVSNRFLIRWIRWSLSRAGATFIKLGQWAATRPDVLPEVFCEELAQLHANAPRHGMKWNEKVIQKAFGKSIENVFEEFDPQPVGSGTIAQVHRARIRQGTYSRAVAVKISHPRIEEIIFDDLLLLSVFARAAHVLIPPLRWISLPDEVACFGVMMRQQLDLRFEAFTLHRFTQNFEGTAKAWGHLARIKFPRPQFPWVSARCLVEDLIEDAIPIGNIQNLLINTTPAESAHVRRDLAVLGFRGFLQMLLWDNFVHADLHPGNILVTFVEMPRRISHTVIGELLESLPRRVWNLYGSVERMMQRIITPGDLPPNPHDPIKIRKLSGESDEQFLLRQLSNPRAMAQVVFLDTGLITELSRPDFKNFTDLFQALVLKGDGYLVGELMIDRSPAKAQENVRDREGFCRGMSEIVKPIFAARKRAVSTGKVTSLRELRLDVVLTSLFQLARRHHVRIDAAYTNLVMSLLCVEGLGRQLAPELDLRPLLAQAALQYLIRTDH